MKIVIGSSITISSPTQEICVLCNRELIIDNPDYIAKLKAGRWIGNTPPKMYLYERCGDDLVVPFGFLNQILKTQSGANAKVVWESYRPREDFAADYQSTIQLYDYQQDVVDKMIVMRNGIAVMPCGSGKTQTALECVAKLGLKTLWLTHTQDLLNQSLERAKNCFDCSDDMFGTITAGKVNISNGITFATVQTMCKLDLAKYRTEWAVVVVDECQHCCGSPTRVTQFYKVVNSLYAPYKYGLTATPYRASDDLDESMYALLGEIITKVDRNQVAGTTCPVKVECISTGYIPDMDAALNGDGTIDYAGLTSDLISNAERFELVSNIIHDRCYKYSMVLANRVEYITKLQQAYAGRSVCISAKGSKRARKEALKKLNSGEIDCIFATYQLAAEGLDCPNLRYVVFATPEKNERIVTQSVGRVARKANGKAYGTVIDFVDDFGMYKSWAAKRKMYYKKIGAEI